MELLTLTSMVPAVLYSIASYYNSREILREIRILRNELWSVREELSEIKKAMRED